MTVTQLGDVARLEHTLDDFESEHERYRQIVALALPVRQLKKLRLLAHVLPGMLDQMAKGDLPNEQQLRNIAAASLDEQKEVRKKDKPSTGDRQVSWWSVAQALQKRRMYARDASFGDDLREAYGIEWAEDLFAPPTRTTATRPMSRRSSAPSRNG